MPEARFRLPHRPGEDGKEINLGNEFLESLTAIAHLIAPACARGEMARTFRLRRDEKNGCDVIWIGTLNRLLDCSAFKMLVPGEKQKHSSQSRSFTGLNWL